MYYKVYNIKFLKNFNKNCMRYSQSFKCQFFPHYCIVESANHNYFYYVKRDSDMFALPCDDHDSILPYDNQIVEFNQEIIDKLNPMMNKLAK